MNDEEKQPALDGEVEKEAQPISVRADGLVAFALLVFAPEELKLG